MKRLESPRSDSDQANEPTDTERGRARRRKRPQPLATQERLLSQVHKNNDTSDAPQLATSAAPGLATQELSQTLDRVSDQEGSSAL